MGNVSDNEPSEMEKEALANLLYYLETGEEITWYLKSKKTEFFIYTHTSTHTQTNTHTYVHMCMFLYVCVFYEG